MHNSCFLKTTFQFLFAFSFLVIQSCEEPTINPGAFDVPGQRGRPAPVVRTVSPASGVAGTEVVIIGKYFRSESISVRK
jgi:hypothetical protein